MTDADLTKKEDADFSDYYAFVDWTLEKQVQEYRLFALEYYNSHLSVVKNYLWLSAIISGAICTVIERFNLSLSSQNPLRSAFMFMLIFSAALSFVAFIRATRLLLAERGGKVPNITDSYLINVQKAYGTNESFNTLRVKHQMIAELQYSIEYLRQIEADKAHKIWALNKYLVIASIFSAVSGFGLFLLR